MLRIGKYRMLGLAGLVAAVAMLAVASVGATSALAQPALPHFKYCVEVNEVLTEPGSWEKPNCTTSRMGGSFVKVFPPARKVPGMAGVWCAEVEPGEPAFWKDNECTNKVAPLKFIRFKVRTGVVNPNAFKSHGLTEKELAVLETVGGHKVECENTTAGKFTVEDEGEFTGPRSSKETVTFLKCKSSGTECNSSGQAKGTIKTEPLVDKPVYLTKAETSEHVGIELTPETGTVFAKFTCASGLETITVGVKSTEPNGKDSIVCPITTTNEVVSEFTLTCKKKGTSAGVQEFVAYWESGVEHVDFLETEGKGAVNFGFEQSSQETTAKIIPSELGEIKA
jgi:hypothetical protein